MPKQFDQELTELEDQLLLMSSKVQEMMKNVKSGLAAWNTEPFSPNFEIEDSIDELQRTIDEQMVHMIVVYTPVAADLRRLLMITRINAELERIADQLANIGFYAKQMFKEPAIKPLVDIPRMIDIDLEMIEKAIKGFSEHTKELAVEVIKQDDSVDSLNDQIFRELMSFVVESPKVITQAIELLLTARAFERIADHAVNIAEDVYYMVEGKDIRHIELNGVNGKHTEHEEEQGTS